MRALEAEQAVIGSILIDSRCLEAVTRLLRPQDFAAETNREIYQVILAMDRAEQRVDPVTVLEGMKRAGCYVENTSRGYMLQLMDTTPTAANVEEYAKIVREASLSRGATAISAYIADEIAKHAKPQEVLLEAAHRLEQLQKEGVEDVLLEPDGAVLAFYDHRERIYQDGDSAYVRTGYQDLDRQLGGGMLNSGMYVLAARPGMGKTTLAINIADRLARNRKPVLIVSLEMDPEQIEAKRIARETGIPANRLLMDALTEKEEESVAHAVDVLRTLPVYFNRRDTVTVAQIEMMARRVKGLALIVIDYIGKILPETRSSDRYDYMTEISGAIKNLARRFRVPVLVLCQLNRAVEARKSPMPVLSDLRDTGAIEQDADGVIFLFRREYYSVADKRTMADLQVSVAKNRHGPVGDCMMTFDLETSKMITSRREPIARTTDRTEKPGQMTFEDMTGKWDGEFPFGDKEEHDHIGAAPKT